MRQHATDAQGVLSESSESVSPLCLSSARVAPSRSPD